jgi:hypothetical protein
MNKNYAILIFTLLSVFAMNANAVLNLTTVHLSAGGNVLTAFNAAAATDSTVIVLDTEGTYLWSGSATVTTPKTVSIVAASGLATRPIVQYSGASATAFFIFYNRGTSGGTLKFDGVTIDGNDKISSSVLAYKCIGANNLNVFMNNCKVIKIASTATTSGGAPIFTYSNGTNAGETRNFNPDSLVITNSTFEASALGTKTTAVLWLSGLGRPKNVVLKNCYFKGPFEKATISNVSTAGSEVKSYLIDHCTFDGSSSADISVFNIAGDPTSTTSISNCLFINNTGTTANALGTGGNLATKCGVFGVTNTSIVYPTAVADGAFTSDPVLSNLFATSGDYYNNGSDGKTIGFYAAPGLTTAVKNTSATILNKMSVIQNGNSFTLKGIENAPYAVYSVNGSLVANGQVVNGKMNLNINKGIYVLKANGQVAKFAVR